jgi:lipopolysaccharide transport system permease protein
MSFAAISTLAQSRDLLWAWTRRTVRARYKQSILGGLWAVLPPVATVAIFSIIFTFFIPVDTQDLPYVVVAYTAMVPWAFFASAVMDMVDSLTVNVNLVSKIYFPREILPTAALFARLLDFAIALLLLLAMMIFYRLPLLTPSWLYLPIVLAAQLALALGLGFAGGALNVFYRDIRHLVALGLQLWFYATPIIYPVSVVPEQWRSLYFLNPMAGIIESYRAIFLHAEAPPPQLGSAAILALVILLAGYWLFKRVEFQFADLV